MRGLILTVAAAAVIGVAPAPAGARDVHFGPRFDVSDDADFGVGADIRWTFLKDDPRLALTASFDYFFPEDGEPQIDDALPNFDRRLPVDLLRVFGFHREAEREYWEANLNLTWDFTADHPVVPYAGVGASYGRSKASLVRFDVDEGDVGANVLAGIRIKRRFYVEAKQEAGGGELFVLTVGVRF